MSPISALLLLGLSLSACGSGAILLDDAPGVGDDSTGDSQRSVDSGEAELPELGLRYSADRGFYDAPFALTLSADIEGATIAWTLDGSDPRTSPTASAQVGPVELVVDPRSEEGRDPAPGVVVRAVARLEGHPDSEALAHSYIFPGELAALSPHDERPGPGWPRPYQTESIYSDTQAMDYGLDPRVTEDPAYAALITEALLAIPTVSLSTDLDNLFDEDEGIYENATEHGRDWERPASLELLDPADAHEVQVNMGLRVRGGWSRYPSNPKHAFRFFFREEYGASKLEFDLFEGEGVGRFDKVDLRTAQNYSWSFKTSEGRENTFLRDVFSRDLHRELGQPYTRSRYYHLFINGVYWGLYQTQERAEARYAASYLGGEVEDYDVVKVNGDDPGGRVIEATDGTLALWEEVWRRCEEGLGEDAAYYALQGLDAQGRPDPDQRALVDVDNLIQYMLVIFYTGNFDAPTGAFTDNSGPNNFFAIISREDPEQGFRFLVHDSEHSLLSEAWSPGVGLVEDRVNLGTRGDRYRMTVTRFELFHPQWLHHRLTANARYRARFAELARAALAEDGPMSEERVTALVQGRAAEIELAIVLESARWGDAKDFREGDRVWRTRDEDWRPAVRRVVEDWIPFRRAIVIGQLEEAGLW